MSSLGEESRNREDFCNLLKVRFLSSHEIMKQGTRCLVGELEEEQRRIVSAKKNNWVNLLSRDFGSVKRPLNLQLFKL